MIIRLLFMALCAIYMENVEACASILDFGGDNTGVSDNSAAFASAASASSTHACIYFPSGQYRFSSGVIYPLSTASSSVTIKGDGPGVSVLQWDAGGGLRFEMQGGESNSVHVRDLSLTTGGAGVGASALSFVNNGVGSAPEPREASDVTNVSIHGSDGFAQNYYWTNGIYEKSWSNLSIKNVVVTGSAHGGDLPGYAGQGVGIYLSGGAGGADTPQGVVYNIYDSQFNYLYVGIQYNSWTQGVNVSHSNFVGGRDGIYVTQPASGQDQLTVVDNHFNESDYGIVDAVGTAGMIITGNYFLVPSPSSSNAGVSLESVYEAVVSNNVFQRIGAVSTGTNGLSLSSNSYAGASINGNVLTGLQTGIYLHSQAHDNNIQSNVYQSNGSNIVDFGSGNQKGGGSP